MSTTLLSIRADAPIGQISPRLYGHFAEHLGRCCYDGLWLGATRPEIAREQGFRSDVLAALKALPVPLLRWPGGCYADHYHWRDGIGPAAARPIRLGMSCGLQVEDDNSLGTHEFLWLCAQLGAEPYLAGNVGSGTPQELCDWLEYCNTSVPTTLGRERAANGSPSPFGVKLWGVGNENWGCGGNYDAEGYTREYIRYATMLRHVDPSAELVICGHDRAWNAEVIARVSRQIKLVDHFSIHHYWTNGGPEVDFSDAEYYTLLAEAGQAEQFIQDTAAMIRDTVGDRQPIGIALDEWGVWHPEARPWGAGDVVRRQPTTYEQAGTLRDALAAAVALEGFHRQCGVLTLANLAQIVNVLHAPVMTDGPRLWLTPTYYALQLHQAHIGATALPVEVSAAESLPDGTPAVTATASRSASHLATTLINRHLERPATVRIACGDAPGALAGQMLTADHPSAGNSADRPDRVALQPLAVAREGADWVVELPAHTMATIIARA